MSDTIKIAGIPIQVVSDEEAEKADFVVCCYASVPSPFDDNVRTRCAFCDEPIIHRPTVPARPPKICIQCAMEKTKEPN